MRQIAASLMLAGLLLAAPSASATYPGRNGDLVAVLSGDKYPDSPHVLIRVSPGGTPGTESVICQPEPCGGISGAAVSPDGRRLVAISSEKQPVGREYLPLLKVIGLETGGESRIPLPATARDGLPASYGGVTWSPDGSRWLLGLSVMDGAAGGSPLGLNFVGRDGAVQGQLVDGDASQADWSPRWDVAFVRGDARAGQGTLWVRRTDGTVKQLTSPGAQHPSWSPDGRKIAFAHGCDNLYRGPGCGIYVISAAGGPPRLLARRGGMPVWSPDGKRVAFLRTVGSDLLLFPQALFVADVKTRRVRQLTREEINPGWRQVLVLDWQPIQTRRALRQTSTTSRTDALR